MSNQVSLVDGWYTYPNSRFYYAIVNNSVVLHYDNNNLFSITPRAVDLPPFLTDDPINQPETAPTIGKGYFGKKEISLPSPFFDACNFKLCRLLPAANLIDEWESEFEIEV